MKRDPDKQAAWRRRGVENYRARLRAAIEAGRKAWTSLKPVNHKRKAKLRAKQFGEDGKREWIISLPCLVCGKSPSEPAHAQSRGAGGTYHHMVPLCNKHHREQHMVGVKTFNVYHGINLMDEAESYHRAWLLRGAA